MNRTWVQINGNWVQRLTWVSDEEPQSQQTVGAIVYHGTEGEYKFEPVPYGCYLTIRHASRVNDIDTMTVVSSALAHFQTSSDGEAFDHICSELDFQEQRSATAARVCAGFKQFPHGRIHSPGYSIIALSFAFLLIHERGRDEHEACLRAATVARASSEPVLEILKEASVEQENAIKQVISMSTITNQTQLPEETQNKS